jgi:hypothetical protein
LSSSSSSKEKQTWKRKRRRKKYFGKKFNTKKRNRGVKALHFVVVVRFRKGKE